MAKPSSANQENECNLCKKIRDGKVVTDDATKCKFKNTCIPKKVCSICKGIVFIHYVNSWNICNICSLRELEKLGIHNIGYGNRLPGLKGWQDKRESKKMKQKKQLECKNEIHKRNSKVALYNLSEDILLQITRYISSFDRTNFKLINSRFANIFEGNEKRIVLYDNISMKRIKKRQYTSIKIIHPNEMSIHWINRLMQLNNMNIDTIYYELDDNITIKNNLPYIKTLHLENMGGKKIMFNSWNNFSGVENVYIKNVFVDNVNYFKNISILKIDINDTIILRDFCNLEVLEIRNTEIQNIDSNYNTIGYEMPKLRSLKMVGCTYHGIFLFKIIQTNILTELFIANNTGAMIIDVAQCTDLEKIKIIKSPKTHIQNLETGINIRDLYMENMGFADNILKIDNKKIERLSIVNIKCNIYIIDDITSTENVSEDRSYINSMHIYIDVSKMQQLNTFYAKYSDNDTKMPPASLLSEPEDHETNDQQHNMIIHNEQALYDNKIYYYHNDNIKRFY